MLLAALPRSPAEASESGIWALTPTAGIASYDANGGAGKAPNAGLKLDYGLGSDDLPRELHVEGVFSFARSIPSSVSSSPEMYALRIGPLWALAPFIGITPLVSAGFGMMYGNNNPQTKTSVNPFVSFGGGASYSFANRTALRADINRFQTLDTSVVSGYEVTLGLSYAFDKAATKGPRPSDAPANSTAPVHPSATDPGKSDPAMAGSAPKDRAGSLPTIGPIGAVPAPDAGAEALRQTSQAALLSEKPASVPGQAVANEKGADFGQERPVAPAEASLTDRYEPSTRGLSGMEAMETLTFASGSLDISRACWKQLERVADLVRANPELQIRILAHTDNTGSSHANYLLSTQRARRIKKHLVKVLGLDANCISAKGYGSYQPVADNASAQGRKANRRAVMIIVEKQQEPNPAGIPGAL